MELNPKNMKYFNISYNKLCPIIAVNLKFTNWM